MALDMALYQKSENSPTPLIHHSDRGIQYCCHQYINLLEDNQALISMTETPDPYENALAERTNLTMKHEFLLVNGFPSFHQAYHATKKAIQNYNHLRPHASLDYLTPAKAHELNIPLKKRWPPGPGKNIPDLLIKNDLMYL